MPAHISGFASFLFRIFFTCVCTIFALYGQGNATATWTGGAGTSNWYDAGNWSWSGDNGACQNVPPTPVGSVPGQPCYEPNVVIPGGVTVNANGGAVSPDVNNFSLGADSSLQGTVSASGNATVAAGASVNGGVEASKGTLTNQGTITGSAIGATIVNSGTIKIAGQNGQVYVPSSGSGTNAGTIEATSNGSYLGVSGGGLTGAWNNSNGTIQIDSGATLICAATVTGGTLEGNGSIGGAGGGLTLGGKISAFSLTIDALGGPATVTVTGSVVVAGPVIVGESQGTSTLNVNTGTLQAKQITLGDQAAASGQLFINGGSVTGTALTVGNLGGGQFNALNGSMAQVGVVTIGAGGNLPLGNQFVVTDSAVKYITLHAAAGNTANPAILVNGGGTLTGSLGEESALGGPTGDEIDSSAEVTGAGSLWNPNSGLTVAGGTTTITAGGALNVNCTCSSVYIADGHELEGIPPDAFQIIGRTTGGATVQVSGSGSAITTSTVNIGLVAFSTPTANQSTLNLFDGAVMTGDLVSVSERGMLQMGGSGTKLSADLTVIGGTANVQNQAAITAPRVYVYLGGDVEVTTGGSISTNIAYLTAGTVTIQTQFGLTVGGNSPAINIGGQASPAVLNFTGVAANVQSNSLAGNVNVNVFENGTLEISNSGSLGVIGTVSLRAQQGQADGGTINVINGQLVIGALNTLLSKGQGWVTVVLGGTLKGGTINQNNQLENAAGAVVVDGSVANFLGNVSLDPVTLQVTQDFVQTGGTLDLQIAGSQSGQFDQLNAGGSIQITGGTVQIDFINGFGPSSGDVYNLMSAPGGVSVSGANYTTTGVASGFNYTTATNNGEFNLMASNSGTATTSAPPPPPAPTLTTLNAASNVAVLAPGILASTYGTGLATGSPVTTPVPWPITVGGTAVTIVDESGTSTPAPILYASSTEVNFQIPDTVLLGPATITVTAGDGTMSSQQVNLVPVAPGLFAVNSSGLSASFADCVAADGTQTTILTSQAVNGALVAVPLNLNMCQQTILELWTTGLDAADATTVQATIGGQDATVLYAGPQNYYPGVDQVNIVIPQSLAGAGNVPVVVTAGGVTSNTVNVTIQ